MPQFEGFGEALHGRFFVVDDDGFRLGACGYDPEDAGQNDCDHSGFSMTGLAYGLRIGVVR